jgi:hypothetical protein
MELQNLPKKNTRIVNVILTQVLSITTLFDKNGDEIKQ